MCSQWRSGFLCLISEKAERELVRKLTVFLPVRLYPPPPHMLFSLDNFNGLLFFGAPAVAVLQFTSSQLSDRLKGRWGVGGGRSEGLSILLHICIYIYLYSVSSLVYQLIHIDICIHTHPHTVERGFDIKQERKNHQYTRGRGRERELSGMF